MALVTRVTDLANMLLFSCSSLCTVMHTCMYASREAILSYWLMLLSGELIEFGWQNSLNRAKNRITKYFKNKQWEHLMTPKIVSLAFVRCINAPPA